MTAPRHRPWYREPMVWLVLGLPLVVVIASLATLAIALRSGGNDAVPAEVRRSAQIQISNLRADQNAAQLGLSARMAIEADTGAVTLTLSSPAPGAGIVLRMSHPVHAAEDMTIPLTPSGESLLGRIERLDGSHDWLLQLGDDDRQWRLHGRLERGQTRTRLSPALGNR